MAYDSSGAYLLTLAIFRKEITCDREPAARGLESSIEPNVLRGARKVRTALSRPVAMAE